MSSVYSRRRSPFSPYDPNDPEGIGPPDQSMFAPNYGGGGQPQQPPPQQGPPPSMYAPSEQMPPMEQPAPQMFTPPPMPDRSEPSPRDARDAGNPYIAPQIPQVDQGNAPAPNQSGGRGRNALGDEMMPRPEPPPLVPYPKYNPFSLGHENAYARAAVDAERAHNDKIFEAQQRAYENELYHQSQAGYFRNLYGAANPGRDETQLETARIRGDTARDVQYDRGNAAADVAGIRGDSARDVANTRAGATTSAAGIRAGATTSAAGIRAGAGGRGTGTGEATQDAVARRTLQGRAMVLADPADPSKGKVYDGNLFNQLWSDYKSKGHAGMGDLHANESQAAPPAPQSGGADTPESIRADFKAGKITREQAKQKLAAHGFK